jgi:hypothetical protein
VTRTSVVAPACFAKRAANCTYSCAATRLVAYESALFAQALRLDEVIRITVRPFAWFGGFKMR